MEYIIAGLRLDIPREFATGSFGMALAPFAAKNATGNTTPPAGAAVDAAADTNPATNAAGSANVTVNRGITPAAPAAYGLTADSARGDLKIIAGQPVGAGAEYRELDAFDFADADADCRFGRDAEGYLLTMTPRDGSAPAHFRKVYDMPVATSDFGAHHNPALFRFGLWTMFNIVAVERQAVAVHSSVIRLGGEAVLFLGESGTGKSTHTRLWREHIPGAELLNDDSPIVRIAARGTAGAAPGKEAGRPTPCAGMPSGIAPNPGSGSAPSTSPQAVASEVLACGAPWSGKTPCYHNLSCPIRAIVRLSQAPQNRIRRLRPIEAIGALLPSCPPSFAHDERLQDAVCRLISGVVAQVPVYHLECLPDAAAAELACRTVFGEDFPNARL